MRLVLGLDGGQTTTVAVLADETGRLLGAGAGGPANHIHEAGGIQRVQRSLADAIPGATSAAGLPNARIAAAYLGITGGSPEMESICRPVVTAESVILGHDSRIALWSVTLGMPGVTVIGGTGSVAYGVNARGESALVGGWGYLMGDEGSGYWIALKALNACTRAADGRARSTAMEEAILAHLGAADLRDAHRKIYSGALSRPDIASVASVLPKVAARGDAAAQRILREAGVELGLLACAALRALGMTSDSPEVGYVFWGGGGGLWTSWGGWGAARPGAPPSCLREFQPPPRRSFSQSSPSPSLSPNQSWTGCRLHWPPSRI
jgi:N-acetylglucosamine kinase-like BadF-type ATPase